MDAVNICRLLGLDRSLCLVTNSHFKIKALISSLPCCQFVGPNLVPRCGNFALPSRLRVSYGRNKGLQLCFRAPRISCMLEDSDGDKKQTEQLDSPQEAAIDLKLPRRSLLVTFTCDACGARSQRLINRLAYERGLVYVQCSGCSQYHKLVDNLGLVIEHNLQEEIDPRASADQA